MIVVSFHNILLKISAHTRTHEEKMCARTFHRMCVHLHLVCACACTNLHQYFCGSSLLSYESVIESVSQSDDRIKSCCFAAKKILKLEILLNHLVFMACWFGQILGSTFTEVGFAVIMTSHCTTITTQCKLNQS